MFCRYKVSFSSVDVIPAWRLKNVDLYNSLQCGYQKRKTGARLFTMMTENKTRVDRNTCRNSTVLNHIRTPQQP